MWIKELQAKGFRNLEEGRLTLQPGLNWLHGGNGQGKTNYLEAAYFSLTGKSFRTKNAAELIMRGASECAISARVVKGVNTWEYGVRFGQGKTTRLLGGKACASLDFFKSSSIIAFTARSKNLVEGSPDDRRRFIDRMIACTEPEYMMLLSKYRKILSQLRPVLLKRGDLGVYRGFKSILAPVGRAIVEKRRGFLENVRGQAGELYRDVFQGSGALELTYKTRNVPDLAHYEQQMMQVSAQELLHGKSLVGPHLDDLEISLRDVAARRYASSGQVRAVVLSTKMAVRDRYFQRFGYHPIFLLDDIDAELDPDRLRALLSYLSTRGQCLISTSKYDTIGANLEGAVYVVDAGRISPQGRVNE